MSNWYVPRTDVYRPAHGTFRQHTPAPVLPDDPPNHSNEDVNRIPLAPRHHATQNTPQRPQSAATHLDPLVHRTTRAYDLVLNYIRDSSGGTRWSREDIDDIGHVGRYLHEDLRALKHWKGVVARGGDGDEGLEARIVDDEERLKRYYPSKRAGKATNEDIMGKDMSIDLKDEAELIDQPV
ncbi:hypothetical protein G6011_11759 [Alternaria panax]|uniref:Uncharacterized protein n=1 Tax=Alternaria panax TaxID=48097 RepID=A0AAD4F6Y4_9PLEO|nr:hypothetical protein G6011_11759 [Alternaria panax]